MPPPSPPRPLFRRAYLERMAQKDDLSREERTELEGMRREHVGDDFAQSELWAIFQRLAAQKESPP